MPIGSSCSIIWRATILPAMYFIISMSNSIFSSISGLRTFKTTLLPSLSWAKCTCAIDALAKGISSNRMKRSSIFLPVSSSIIFLASAPGNGGTWVCSFSNSATNSSGIISGRLLKICANLIYVVPSSSTARRMRSHLLCS